MDLIEHFQDNLNQNFLNSQAVDNFIRAGKAAEDGLNNKYSDGEFADPALTDPQVKVEPSWYNVEV